MTINKKNGENITLDLKLLMSGLGVTAILVGVIMWFADLHGRACTAERISKENSIEIQKLTPVATEMRSIQASLGKIETDLRELRNWVYKKSAEDTKRGAN